MLQSMGSQRVGHNWATEVNWSEFTCGDNPGQYLSTQWTPTILCGHGLLHQELNPPVQYHLFLPSFLFKLPVMSPMLHPDQPTACSWVLWLLHSFWAPCLGIFHLHLSLPPHHCALKPTTPHTPYASITTFLIPWAGKCSSVSKLLHLLLPVWDQVPLSLCRQHNLYLHLYQPWSHTWVAATVSFCPCCQAELTLTTSQWSLQTSPNPPVPSFILAHLSSSSSPHPMKYWRILPLFFFLDQVKLLYNVLVCAVPHFLKLC